MQQKVNIYEYHMLIRFTIVTAAYLVFWGPLFLITLVHWRMDWTDARSSVTHQVFDDDDDDYGLMQDI